MDMILERDKRMNSVRKILKDILKIPPFEYFNKNYEVVAWMPMFDEYKGE